MVMTAYHWRKLPELIGKSRVQAEVRPTMATVHENLTFPMKVLSQFS